LNEIHIEDYIYRTANVSLGVDAVSLARATALPFARVEVETRWANL